MSCQGPVWSGLFLPMAAGNSRTKTLWLCVLWFWWQQILIGSYYHVTLGNSGDCPHYKWTCFRKTPSLLMLQKYQGLKPAQPTWGFGAGHHHLTLEYGKVGQRV